MAGDGRVQTIGELVVGQPVRGVDVYNPRVMHRRDRTAMSAACVPANGRMAKIHACGQRDRISLRKFSYAGRNTCELAAPSFVP